MLGVAAGAAQAGARSGLAAAAVRGDPRVGGVVSVIGLLQHLEALPFAMAGHHTPGSTFGNRNMGGEAVALALPFGFATVVLRGAGRARSASPSRSSSRSCCTWR
jgi:hypothetical protein